MSYFMHLNIEPRHVELLVIGLFVTLGVLHVGLDGAAMLRWDVPDEQLHSVLQHIKTFSPEGDGWRDPDDTLGDPVEPGDDPRGSDRQAEAVRRGGEIYHGAGGCYSCHPSHEDVAGQPPAGDEWLAAHRRPASSVLAPRAEAERVPHPAVARRSGLRVRRRP